MRRACLPTLFIQNGKATTDTEHFSLSLFRFALLRFVPLVRWLVDLFMIMRTTLKLTTHATTSADRQWTAVETVFTLPCEAHHTHTYTPSRRWKTQQRQRTLEIIEQTKSQFIMRLLKTHNFLFRHSRKTTNRSDVKVAMEWEISHPYAAFGGNPWKW